MDFRCIQRLFLLLCSLLFAGHASDAFSYDYTASTECLVEPQKPQYGGGIIANPEFNNGLDGWDVFGRGVVEERISNAGNSFITAHNRTQPSDSFSQRLHLEEGKLYTLSAWVQISGRSETVAVVIRSEQGQLTQGGTVTAKSGCWSMLKGGFSVNFSGPAYLHFESENTAMEIWVDNVSLQPFTKEQWRSHQSESIEKIRKTNVRFHATDAHGNQLVGSTLSINQIRPTFPFGCAMNQNILMNAAYRSWFTSRFTATTFGNEMKWYSTERQPGHEDYMVPDAMVAFAEHHHISVRGHNIFWDNLKFQPSWVKNLSSIQLREASTKRIKSVVSRYAGRLIAWDVVNENLHFSFFEDKLGQNASAAFYARAQELDPTTTMFMNEFNTVEDSKDGQASPHKYLEKLREIRSYPGHDGLLAGIGLQAHFASGPPNLAYMRASMDVLGATGLPLWLTEVDVDEDPNQAQYLEEILREGYSHPAVQGIIIWSGPAISGCKTMCLTDEHFMNTPSGDVVDKLISEWESRKLIITINSNGPFEVPLFHGEYNVTLTHPLMNSSTTLSFKVVKGTSQEAGHVQHVHIHA